MIGEIISQTDFVGSAQYDTFMYVLPLLCINNIGYGCAVVS